MKKTLLVRNRNQVTLPKEMLEDGVHEFELEKLKDGSYRLTPMVAIPASQRYFWTKRWQDGERQVSREIKAGRLKRGTVEDLINEIEGKRHIKKSA